MTSRPDPLTGSDTTGRGRADPLLEELMRQPAEARLAWLAARASTEPDAVARIEALLLASQDDDGFLSPGGALTGAIFGELCRDILSGDEAAPALQPGTAIGRYVVDERIGVGGMGEVYRARDSVLGRRVALKVLPAGVVGDDRRVARLRREARVLAALNHPNVGAIYDLEEHANATVLVLELVEGPTLGDRRAGGTLRVDEVRDIARQVVDALEAAHQRGIVHRDLKPGNIKIGADGRVKVLDFGIATVLRDAAAGAPEGSLLVSGTDTIAGVVRGTTAYMCPEQLRGEAVDHRADIWAFGCVLFELLAGVTPFARRSQAETLAAILGRAPVMDQLPASTPRAMRELVAACLEKDVARRLGRIGDARALLDARTVHDAGAPLAGRTFIGRARRAGPVVLGLGIGAAAAGFVQWTAPPAPPSAVARLTVPVPVTDTLVTGALPSVALSPDGSTVVYRARRGDQQQLFLRALDAAEPVAIAGTSNATAPFFSPDGRWVGFDRQGMLQKVPLAGGAATTVCATEAGGVASSWSDRGDIVFASTSGQGLFRVPAAGGTAAAITRIDRRQGDQFHAFPEVLPGGRHALFTIGRREGPRVAVVSLDTGAITELAPGGQARYLVSGHLLVVRDDTVWAAPFDVRRLALTGTPRPVLRGLESNEGTHFAVARNGSLLYVPRREREGPGGDLAAGARLLLVQNWVRELVAQLPDSP